MPSARAVCRLMTNSNLVDCSTGRSAGACPRVDIGCPLEEVTQLSSAIRDMVWHSAWDIERRGASQLAS